MWFGPGDGTYVSSWSTRGCPRASSASARRTTSRAGRVRGGTGGVARLLARARHRMHGRARSRRVPVDLRPRPRRSCRGDRDAWLWLRRRRAARLADQLADAATVIPQLRRQGEAALVIPAQASSQLVSLAFGDRPDDPRLSHRDRRKEPAAACTPQRCWLISRSAIDMLSASHGPSKHDLGHRRLALGYLPLELGARQPHAVGLCERRRVLLAQVLSQLLPSNLPAVPPARFRRGPCVVCMYWPSARADTAPSPAPRTRQCGRAIWPPVIVALRCVSLSSLTRDLAAQFALDRCAG